MNRVANSLKVYGWQDHRPGVGQVRAIVAARSKAAAARYAGESDPRRLFNLDETGNAIERQVALAQPGIVHWVRYRASGDASVWRAWT